MGASVVTVVSGREVSEVTGAVVSGAEVSEVTTDVPVVGSLPAVWRSPPL